MLNQCETVAFPGRIQLNHPIQTHLLQGLEKAFKAYKYNKDYSEDHSHELGYLIPNIDGLRAMASPLVVCISSRSRSRPGFNTLLF